MGRIGTPLALPVGIIMNAPRCIAAGCCLCGGEGIYIGGTVPLDGTLLDKL